MEERINVVGKWATTSSNDDREIASSLRRFLGDNDASQGLGVSERGGKFYQFFTEIICCFLFNY